MKFLPASLLSFAALDTLCASASFAADLPAPKPLSQADQAFFETKVRPVLAR